MKRFPYVLLACLFVLFACDNDRNTARRQTIQPAPGPQAAVPLTLDIVKPLAILSLGEAVDVRLEAKGDVDAASLIWTLTGDIPAGVMLQSSGRTAALVGTVREPKTYKLTVTVKDSSGQTASQRLTWEVSANPISIVTQTLPAAWQGESYSAFIEAKGGVDAQYAWKLDDKSLPKGLTSRIEGSKLLVSGATNEVGSFTLVASVRNNFGQEVSQTLNLKVQSALKIIQEKIPVGIQNAAYTYKMRVEGGKGLGFTWTIPSGTLPKGLKAQVSADTATWTLDGQPEENGIYKIQVVVTDAYSGRASTDLALDMRPALSFVTTTLPEGKAGTPYKAEIQVQGGLNESYQWKNVSGLPTEIKASYDNKKGTLVIEGTPMESGYKYFNVEIGDTQSTLARGFSFYVKSTPPVIVTESLPDVAYGQEVRLLIQGKSLENRSMRWRKDDESFLPPGLWLQSSSSNQVLLSGYTMYPGTYSFKLIFSDSQGFSEKVLQLRVLPPVPAFTLLGRHLPRGFLNQKYEADLFTKNGRIKSLTWEGRLPKGIQLQQADDNILRLTGVIKETGFFPFKIRVQSLSGATAEGSYALAVTQKMDWMIAGGEQENFLIHKYDVSKKIPLNGQDLLRDYSLSPDGRWFAYKTSKTSTGWQDLFLIDLSQAQPTTVRVSDWVDGRISWSPDSTKLVFHKGNSRGFGGMHVYDVLTQADLKGSGIMVGADSTYGIHWDLWGQQFAYCHRYRNSEVKIANLASGEVEDVSIWLQNVECREPKFAVQSGFLFLGRDVVRIENREVRGEARFPWNGAMTTLMENPSRLIVGSLKSPFLEFVWNSSVPSDPRSFMIEGEATDWDRFGLSKDESSVFVQRGKESYTMYGAVLTRDTISPQKIEVKDDHLNMILDFVNASESGHTIVRTESGYYDMDLATLQRRRIADADALRVEQLAERTPASSYYLVRENSSTWTLRSYQNPMEVLETISSTASYISVDPWDAFAVLTPKVLSSFAVLPAREQSLEGYTWKSFLRY